MENIQRILEQATTKTNKIKMLLQLGMTRKQVAEAMGVGYGFVQNVYASVYGVAHPRKFLSERFSSTVLSGSKWKLSTAARRKFAGR